MKRTSKQYGEYARALYDELLKEPKETLARRVAVEYVTRIAYEEIAAEARPKLQALRDKCTKSADWTAGLASKLLDKNEALGPAANLGEKFQKGRVEGTLGQVRKKIRAYMKQHPDASAVEVWNALKKKPPRGFDFREPTASNRYVEFGAITVMQWRRFQNLVSEERPK